MASKLNFGQRIAARAIAFGLRRGGDELALRRAIWRIYGGRRGDDVCEAIWQTAIARNGIRIR